MPEGSKSESELSPEENNGPEKEGPLEILQKGRDRMKKSAYMKIVKEELEELKIKHRDLSGKLEAAITEVTKLGILKQLDKNEENQAKVNKEIQAVQDRVKKQIIDSVKSKK